LENKVGAWVEPYKQTDFGIFWQEYFGIGLQNKKLVSADICYGCNLPTLNLTNLRDAQKMLQDQERLKQEQDLQNTSILSGLGFSNWFAVGIFLLEGKLDQKVS
jgi:hypothetical protein